MLKDDLLNLDTALLMYGFAPVSWGPLSDSLTKVTLDDTFESCDRWKQLFFNGRACSQNLWLYFFVTALVSALDGWNDQVHCNTDLSQGGTVRTGTVQAYTTFTP